MSVFRRAQVAVRPLLSFAATLAALGLISRLAVQSGVGPEPLRALNGWIGMGTGTAGAVLALAGALSCGREVRIGARGLAAASLLLCLGRGVPALAPLYRWDGVPVIEPSAATLLAMTAAAFFAVEARAYLIGTVAHMTVFGGALMYLFSHVFVHDHLSGEMSLGASVAILCLAYAGVICRGDRGVMRVLLNEHASGRQARAQMLLGVVAPILLGTFYLLADPELATRAEMLLLLATIVGVNVGLIILMAVSLERTDHARRAVERKLLNRAMRDGLTGLFNREMLSRRFQQAFSQGMGEGVPFTALMIDIDHFRQVNNRGGHALGDLVLRRAGRKMRAQLRLEDTLARIGGDEFAVILPGARLTEGLEAAERLRAAVAALGFEGQQAPGLRVTVSIGVAEWECGEELRSLYARADGALYAAKNRGRNRVLLAQPSFELRASAPPFAAPDTRVEALKLKSACQPEPVARRGANPSELQPFAGR